jgi:hypothetical protein
LDENAKQRKLQHPQADLVGAGEAMSSQPGTPEMPFWAAAANYEAVEAAMLQAPSTPPWRAPRQSAGPAGPAGPSPATVLQPAPPPHPPPAAKLRPAPPAGPPPAAAASSSSSACPPRFAPIDWNDPATIEIEKQITFEYGRKFGERGPPAPDEGGPEKWRGQVWRAESKRWGNRGGKNAAAWKAHFMELNKSKGGGADSKGKKGSGKGGGGSAGSTS